MGNHPTKHPPPMLLPFLMPTGRLAMHAMTRYALTEPAVDTRVLSAYKMKAKGAPWVSLNLGKEDWWYWDIETQQQCMRLWQQKELICAYLNPPPMISSPWLVNETLISHAIVFVQLLCIPNKVWCKERVLQHVDGPIPEWLSIHIKFEIVFLVVYLDHMMLKLCTYESDSLVLKWHRYDWNVLE